MVSFLALDLVSLKIKRGINFVRNLEYYRGGVANFIRTQNIRPILKLIQ